jgi:hypothetical protein
VLLVDGQQARFEQLCGGIAWWDTLGQRSGVCGGDAAAAAAAAAHVVALLTADRG